MYTAHALQDKQLQQVRGQLNGIQAGQEAVAEKVQQSLTAVHTIHQQALGLEAQMRASIDLEVRGFEKIAKLLVCNCMILPTLQP